MRAARENTHQWPPWLLIKLYLWALTSELHITKYYSFNSFKLLKNVKLFIFIVQGPHTQKNWQCTNWTYRLPVPALKQKLAFSAQERKQGTPLHSRRKTHPDEKRAESPGALHGSSLCQLGLLWGTGGRATPDGGLAPAPSCLRESAQLGGWPPLPQGSTEGHSRKKSCGGLRTTVTSKQKHCNGRSCWTNAENERRTYGHRRANKEAHLELHGRLRSSAPALRLVRLCRFQALCGCRCPAITGSPDGRTKFIWTLQCKCGWILCW